MCSWLACAVGSDRGVRERTTLARLRFEELRSNLPRRRLRCLARSFIGSAASCGPKRALSLERNKGLLSESSPCARSRHLRTCIRMSMAFHLSQWRRVYLFLWSGRAAYRSSWRRARFASRATRTLETNPSRKTRLSTFVRSRTRTFRHAAFANCPSKFSS